MRRVLITGASDGIGAALAKALYHTNDYELVLFGRDQERLHAVATECGDAEHYAFDLNDYDRLKEAVKSVGEIDVLINNAGIWHKMGELDSLSSDEISAVLTTNLLSQILLTRELLPSLKNKKNSAIINIISKSGVVPQKGQSVYTASKYGMRGFTDVLREDVKEYPIKIGAVYQSGTNTDMFKKAGEEFSTDDFTDPEDLADVIVFMLSRPKKLWINEIRIEK